MDIIKLYNKLDNIAERLYGNDNSAWGDLQVVLSELNEFISLASVISQEMRIIVLNSFSRLLDAIKNVDQLLAADTVYYEICEILAEYEKIVNNRDIKEHAKKKVINSRVETAVIFNKNIECLYAQKDKEYDKILEYCKKIDLNDEEIAVDEYGNIEVKKDNRWWRINSFYNSKCAAELAVKEIKKQNYISAIYIFGMGNLDTVKAIVDSVASDTIVFIYEPNPKVAGVNSYYHDWSEILNKEKVFLFVDGLNDNKLEESTLVCMDNVTFLYSYVYVQPEYGRIYIDKINAKLEQCKQSVRNAVYMDNTIDLYADLFNYNRIMNLPYIRKSVLLSELKKALHEQADMENATAVLVAAGPSLDENIEYLKQLKGRAFIIAVDSAIMMCEKHGIKPDAYATIDPQKQEVLFENTTAMATPLFWGLPSVYKQVSRLKGTKIFCNCDTCVPDWIADTENYISPGGSISNMVFSILNFLGFHKIIAIGLDLAFLKDKKHASVIYDDGGINEEERKEYTWVKGQNGEELLTYINFLPYKQDIEKRIKDRKDELVFINSSKGVYIEGAVHIPFHDAIEQYILPDRNDFEQIINRLQRDLTQNQNSIDDIMYGYIDECEKIHTMYEQCYRLYKNFKRIDNPKKLTQTMKEIDCLYEKAERCFAGKMIADASSMQADEIIQTMYKESTNQDTYSKEDINAIADKGMRMAEIFMKNAKKTKELFEESLEAFNG